MKKAILPLLILLVTSHFSFATHNQAGEIIFQQINGTTIEASVITYTNVNSTPADRDTLEICWGDGVCELIGRVNGPNNNGELIGPGTKKNIYTKLHTYSGIGHYQISMTDPNRNAGILNINWPNSENVPFVLITELTLLNPVFNDLNNSPVLLQAPIDVAFTNELYMHSPNAFDIDGDSIAYELVTPAGVALYEQVTEIMPGPNNTLSMNEETGLLIWDAPQQEGLYTIAYLIKSYRDGQEIDRIIRDMLIEVEEGPGFAPEIVMENINGNEEILLVDLGDTIRLNITVTDSDINQEVTITATSGLFDFFSSTATFTTAINGNIGTASFEWIVKEEHLRQEPYQLVIKAEDNTSGHFKSRLAVLRYQTSMLPTGFNETDLVRDIKLFPNPVQDSHLNLYFKQGKLKYKTYSILNTLGQQIQQGDIQSDLTSIPIGGFSSGVYFLLIGTSKERLTMTFIVD